MNFKINHFELLKIIEIKEYDVNELYENIESLSTEYAPCYLSISISSNNLKHIHIFEDIGFRFSEFRINAISNISNFNFNTKSLFPYVINSIVNKKDIDKITDYLSFNVQDDRFSNDYSVLQNVSFQRNLINIKKSLENNDEFLYGIFNSYNNELIAFVSGKYINKTEVIYYQQGIISDSNNINTKDILNLLTIDLLKKRGINNIHINITGQNINEIHLFINKYKFIIQSSKVLLRKIINSNDK